MAPGAKRKRQGGDRIVSHDNHDGASRPSPHRPEELGLAHQGRSQGQHNHNHGQGPHSSSYSQQQGGRRRGQRDRRNSATTNHQPNGTMNTDDADIKKGQDQASNSQSAAAPPTVTVTSPQSNTPRNGTPAPPPRPNTPAVPPPFEPQASIPIPSPHPYHYKIITDDRVMTWADAGRASVLDELVDLYKPQDPIATSIAFQEILRAGLDGRIDAAEAGKLIADSFAAEPIEGDVNLPELFLDTLSILTEYEPSHPLVQPFVLATGISLTLMREVLETPLLKTLGLIRPTFDRMFIRKQTNILYKQSNYNLLREETEGYSKLVTELFTTTNSEPPTAEVVEETFENIKALIGAFDLDAGRVLDVTLDVFASLLVKHYRFFVKLLRMSSWWPHEQSYGLQTESQGFGGLPTWAQPNHSSWLATDDEKANTVLLKSQRDQRFWERARQTRMDAYFELGGRRISDDQDVESLINIAIPINSQDNEDKSIEEKRIEESREWVKATKTLPPAGNAVAAQLLGFKLRFYASAARDAHDTLPVNLIYLAALLIKIGFISLRDLYPHLFPEDGLMTGVKEKMMKEKEEREMAKRPGGGAMNALARAGALADDTLPLPTIGRLRENTTRASTPSRSDPNVAKADPLTSKPEEEQKEILSEPSDQKIQLLRSLLCIGAIPEALYMLGRYTWLPDAFPDLPDHINRLLHHSLQKVYEPLRPLQECVGIKVAAQTPAIDQSGVVKGDLKLQDARNPKTLRWAQLDKNDVEGIDYRFYWDDWSDNIPICQNVDDVFTLCGTLMNLSGVKIGQDSALLVKLARIGKHSLGEDFSQPNQTRWLDLCKRLLAPALSLSKANPGVVNEVYDLMKLFPTPTRYSIYNEWFMGATSRLPDIENAFSLARAETKDILRRMTKTNQRLMARNLAKTACGSPGVVFQVVFGQIESYQNLIELVVECARYFTYMGYDILTWALLGSLGKAGRSRVSDITGSNISQWLASLAKFSGKIFKRYSIMNSLPILQYVLHQLCQDNFADLQVLRDLITSMAGISPDTDFTDAQVQAMSGGELLQSQILLQLQDKRHESKVSGKRLMKTIADHDLAGPLLVAIAQQRQRCMFYDNNTQVKVIAENFDMVHIILTQYYDMLRHNTSVNEFNQLVPDICSLILDYGIDPSIAFMIHRKGIAKVIEEYDAAHPPVKKRKSSDSTKVDGQAQKATIADGTGTSKVMSDVEMIEAPVDGLQVQGTIKAEINGVTQSDPDANGSPPENGSVPSTGPGTPMEVDGKAGDESGPDQPHTKAAVVVSEQLPFKWHPVMQDIMKRIKNVLPVDFETSMSLSFYVSFWQLSLNDLTLPTQSYNAEISLQKAQLATINADRSDMSAAGIQKRDSQKKAVNDFLSRLTEEMKNSVSKHSHVRQRLEKEKHHWFSGFSGKGHAFVNAMLQECFLPRMLMSPIDSQYTWRMFNMLHSSGTPRFRTMFILDRFFDEKVFSNVMFHCTAREIENFARFLNELMKELTSWHASRAEYEKKAFGPKRTLTGFAKELTEDGKAKTLLDYEEFRSLLHKWHVHIHQAMVGALQTNESMHIRNACIVLRSIINIFPAINWMGKKLIPIVEGIFKLEENKKAGVDRREVVFVLTVWVLGHLKAREPHWILPQAFHLNNPTLKPPGGASRAPSSGPKSPHSEGTAVPQTLNAKAPSFEPKARTSTESDRKVPISGKAEVEDGELEDMVMADAKAGESALEESSEAELNATTQSQPQSTKESKPEPKKNEFAEMRARVMASADAKRRQSQAASGHTKPSLIDEKSTSIASTANSAPSNSASQTAGTITPSSNEERSTPAANTQKTSASNLVRPELTGGNSTPTPATPDRQPHALPNRPDSQLSQRNRYPPRQHEATPGGLSDKGESRGRPVQDAQRSDRPAEMLQQRHNDRGGQPVIRPDNRAGYQRPENSGRYADATDQDTRGYRQAPEYNGRLPPSDMRHTVREPMDSRPVSGREERSEPQQGPNPRNETYGPSHQAPSRRFTPGPSNTSELDHITKPDRAARLHQNESSDRLNSYSRQPATFHGPEGSSNRVPRARSRSPTREDRPRDVRSEAARPPYEASPQRDATTEHVPNGPRNAPPPRHGHATEGQSRSEIMQPPPSRAHHDTSSGRFPQDHGLRSQPRHQDDNYGRLNADPGTPQGPQEPSSPNERARRNATGGPTSITRRQSAGLLGTSTSAAGPDRPPTSSDANTDQRSQNQPPQASSSAPPTPAAEDQQQDLSGIHPSRLNQFQKRPQPPTIQTGDVSTPNSQPQSHAPPSGPRSTQPPTQAKGPETPTSANSNLSPAPRNAPAGPANAGDRRNRDGSARRQFADMQQTLSQSGQSPSSGPGIGSNARNNPEQGTSIRGRANAGRQQQHPLNSVQPPPDSGAMQNGHFDVAVSSRDAPTSSHQPQSPAQLPPTPNSGAPPHRDQPEREDANSRSAAGAAGRDRERSLQREARGRTDGNRDYRKREDPAAYPQRDAREQVRETRGEQENREREAVREPRKDPGRPIRGPAPEREREHRDAGSGRPSSGYETRNRGNERDRDRDRERDRRDPAYPPRSGGSSAWGGGGAPEQLPPGPGPGTRRVDGRERRDASGQKRGWGGGGGTEEGGGNPKRQRRGGN